MDKANFPIEFNNEIDDVKKSENEYIYPGRRPA